MTHVTTNETVRKPQEERVLFLAESKLCEQVERASSALQMKRDSVVRPPRLGVNSVSGDLVLGDPSMLVPEAYS